MCITGFKGARGQVEFMLHVVENAPALEVITVDTHQCTSLVMNIGRQTVDHRPLRKLRGLL